MSQNSKKVGLKKLSTKRNSKLDKERKPNSDQLTQHFDSFISLSNSNQDGNRDDSLIIVGSVSKNVLSPESQTDYFQFPKKKSAIAPVKQSCLERTSLSPVSTCSNENLDLEQHGSEVTENQTTSNETCSKYVRVSTLFDDSSLLFQNDANHFKKNQNNDNIVVKALSKNLVSNNDKKNEVNTSSEDNIAIPKMTVNESVNKSDLKFKESVEQSKTETVQQCPICLKTVSKYVSHMKSCAAKNRLNTQQLLSALKLHKKQLAERKELGLDVPAQSYRARVSPKRSRAHDKKGPRDANLQLALALSASLRSAEEDEVIQEAEALKEAGLTFEANQKLGTLEQFGFATAVPLQTRSVQGSSKSRPLPRSVLLERSKEERERIVTEKIAIVLISEEENVSLDTLNSKEPTIKSKLLKKAWDKDCQLWVKAHCQADEERSKFYVDRLLEFVSPCKIEVGAALRRLSQLPGRLNSPGKEDFCDLPSSPNSSTAKEVNIYELPTPPRLSAHNHSLHTAPTDHKSLLSVEIKSQLSEDWKSLVNNPEMSDLEIQCEDGSVPAHRLVFHVRCPKVLLNLNQDNNNKNIILLKNCSTTAAIAMLEFVYAGSLHQISQLDKKDFKSLNDLVDEFDFTELKTHLRKLDKTHKRLSSNESKSENFRQELFGTISKSENDLYGIENLIPNKNDSSEAQRRKSLESNLASFPEPELCPSIELESTDSSSGRGSPDMFGESKVVGSESFSHQTQSDLDILASLLGKTTGIIEEKCNEPSKTDRSKAPTELVVVSPSSSLVNESLSGKRKALDYSDSEEETSFSKRPCSEWSKVATSVNSDEEHVFDLTQSSNSNERISQDDRNDKDKHISQNNLVLHLSKSSNCETIMDNSMEDLTQKDPSIPNSPQHISSTCMKTPEPGSKNICQDYYEPVWDGYDDYLNFNYTPLTTPVKPFAERSTEKKSSQNVSILKNSQLSSSKTNVQDSLLLTPKFSSDVNYISSDSNSPKQSSHQMLEEFSWKSNILDSESMTSQTSRGSKNSKGVTVGKMRKPRQKLSSQFDKLIDSPVYLSPAHTPDKTFSKTSKLSKNSLETSPCKSDDILKKSPLKRDSLAAMQRLLDDSFDINDSVLANADAILAEEAKGSETQISPHPSISYQSKKPNQIILEGNKNSVMTPSPEIIASDKVTPLPDYSAMKTPSLKRELSKFGLKPTLGKRKAKVMLRYIYDQTHPFVPEESRGEQADVFKQPSEQPLRSPMKSPCKKQSEVNLVDSESDMEESCSQKSTSSLSSSATLPEESFCEFDDVLTQDVCSVGDLKSAIRSLIVNNAELHRRVLVYEPIFLEEFMGLLKANGVKSKVKDVMDYLDEQCITFRTKSWKATNEKRKQKNLKKKTKGTTSQSETSNSRKKSNLAKSIDSPSKEQPNPVKKRGRPRKNKEQDSSC